MTHEEWQRVKTVVADAAELPPAERMAFVARQCSDDPALRLEVESVLAHAGDRFERAADAMGGAAESNAEESLKGARLGAYEIVREIGRGGMGAVYLARRADEEFEKEVAIKLLKRGTDTDEVLRRFRTERQILARLEHPNIARLIDAGTTPDGLPYFVMEYVNGARITDFCRDENLNIPQRLELFLKVCAAVHFAHRNLVVHRDLKPGNILITPEREPKLLDFGIAKLLSPDAEFAPMTAQDRQHFTPGYASPEQVRGEPVTTVSDVYSLGAILYELLSGRSSHAFATQHPSATELFRVIVEQQPPRASSVAPTAETRRELRGDLDNILRTALRKEPERRYSGATAFADDIRRCLDGHPVRARPATFAYRAAKFIGRNKIAVAAAVLVLSAVLFGITAYVMETRRTAFHAQREAAHFRDLRKLANLFVFKYQDGIAALPGSTELRKELVKDALEYLNNLASKGTDDPALLRELGTAYKRIADVQGGVLSSVTTGGTLSISNLGDTAGALENYAKALTIREQLARLQPDNKGIQIELAEIYANLGQINVALGKPAEAAEHFRQAIRMLRSLVEKEPNDKTVLAQLRSSYWGLASVLALQPSNLGDTKGALEAMRNGISIGETLLAQEPQNVAYRQSLATGYGETGRLFFNDGRIADALDYYRKALAIGESLVLENPTNPLSRRELAVQHRNVGAALLESGEKAGALEHFRQAIALFEQLVKDDPKDARTRRSSAYGYRDLGEALAANGDRVEAEKNFNTALGIFEELAAKDPKNGILISQQALTHLKMSRYSADGDDLPPALNSAQRAVKIGESLVSANAKDVSARKTLADSYAQLGKCFALLGSKQSSSSDEQREHWQQARNSYQKSAQIWGELGDRGNLSEGDAKKRSDVAAEITRCDELLSQSKTN